jgi:hypothetical protein
MRSKAKEEAVPKLYMNTYEGKWGVVYQGMPCCKNFDDKDRAMKVYHMVREELHWDNTNDIPVWNGDKSQFESWKVVNGVLSRSID